VAMRGSVLGVGTDLAGSVRIPALSCGTFGFKPTALRVPHAGIGSGGRKGHPGIQSCAGPLATSFRDLEFFMSTVIGASPWNYDVTALAIPWRNIDKTKGRLRLGCVADEDSAYPFHPPVIRTLNSAIEKLQQAGHTVVQLQKVPSISEAGIVAFKMFHLDTKNTSQRHTDASGEPTIRSIIASSMSTPSHELTLDDLFELNEARLNFMENWQQIWLDNGLDAIIMPGHRKTAGPHETYGHPPYTVIWNFVDVSSISSVADFKFRCDTDVSSTLPASSRTRKQTFPRISMNGNSPIVSNKTNSQPDLLYRINIILDDAQIVDGAPCAIQVIGRRFQDEELLSVAEQVASALAEK
jgi:amidase